MNEQDLSVIMSAIKTLQEKVAMLETWPAKDLQGRVMKGVREGLDSEPLRGNFKGILEQHPGSKKVSSVTVPGPFVPLSEMHNDRIDKLEAIAAEDKAPNKPIPACTPGARRTSKEWQDIFCTITVLDPDGWDRTNFDFVWNCELITEEQYKARRARSTCRWEATGFKTMPLYTPEPPDKSFSRKMPIKGKMAFEIFRNNCEDKRWLPPFEKTAIATQQRWARIEEEIEKAIADRKIESVVG